MAFDWKKTLATVAPVIASGLGGPMAGVAVKMAADALGVEPNEDALAEAVMSNDPDTLLKLREADHSFKVKMKELGVEVQKLDAQDRDSARTMAQKVGIIPQVALSVVYTIGYFWLLAEIITGGVVIAENMQAIVNTLMGVMTAAQVQIMNFWFGSSSGSKDKDLKRV